MNSDTEFAAFFKYWTAYGDVVETSSATADLFERIWSQVQNFQEGSVKEITATTLTMINFIGREHCLDINQTELVDLIHDRIQHTKSFA
tara:strand:+ start:760 stop:1026 length:267 start_codon:yes stop_codon:yes gene_type:complete